MTIKRTTAMVSMQSIGLFIFSLYISTIYLAQDVVLPSKLNSFCLLAFLGWGVLNTLFSMKFVMNKMSLWMLNYMMLCLITMSYSPVRGVFTGQFYSLIVNFVLILFLSQIGLTKNMLFRIAWIYTISSSILVIFLIITGRMHDISGRLGADLFGNANTMAIILMIATMFSFYLLVYEHDSFLGKLTQALSIGLNYYAMFLSGGRKFIVVPIVFLYILLMFKTDDKGRKHTIKYTITIGILIFILYQLIMNVPAFYEAVGQRMEGLLNMILGEGSTEASAEIRADMVETGLKGWLSSPIWGFGFDSFKIRYNSLTGIMAYSHNNYVELLYNSGIIGFLVYYLFYFKLIWIGVKNKNNLPSYIRAFSIGTTISFLIYEFGAINYSSTPAMIMLFLAYSLQEDCFCQVRSGDSKYEQVENIH